MEFEPAAMDVIWRFLLDVVVPVTLDVKICEASTCCSVQSMTELIFQEQA